MTDRIYKFTLDYQKNQVVCGQVLHVGIDPATGRPTLWAVTPADDTPERLFLLIGTGWPLDEYLRPDARYVGTCVGIPFVWHVYEEPIYG